MMDAKRASEILGFLANGVDPFTGELLDDISPYNNPYAIRALFLAYRALQESIADHPPQKLAKCWNAGQPWNMDEDHQLVEEHKRKMPVKEIARIHGRSEGAINSRLVKLALAKIDYPARD